MTVVDPTRAPTEEDREDALALFVDAFHDDPFYAWLEPRAAERGKVIVGLLSFALAGCALHVLRHEGRAVAAIAWHDPVLPPSGARGRNALAIVARALRHPRRTTLAASVWRAIVARRPRDRAHVVVELLAVAGASRGSGRARALLEAVLARADANGWTTHLETTRPTNLAMYERFGFSPVGEPIVRGDSAPTFCLRRAHGAR